MDDTVARQLLRKSARDFLALRERAADHGLTLDIRGDGAYTLASRAGWTVGFNARTRQLFPVGDRWIPRLDLPRRCSLADVVGAAIGASGSEPTPG